MSNVAYATAGSSLSIPGGTMASQFKVAKQGNQAVIVPHTQTFSSLFNWMSKTYRFRFDEAVNKNYDSAKSMLNDAFIQGLYRNRMTPVVKSDFRVISHGNGKSDEVEEFYASLLKQIPLWHEFRRNIMQCAWHGRFGVQMAFDDQTYEGRKFTWNGKAARSISHWLPHMGDKITFTFDMYPCIRVSPMYIGDWQSRYGATVLQPGDPRIAREAVGYRWTEEGPVVVLDNPEVRKQFAISIFEIQDAPWDDPQLAGGIRGIGLRHYTFWNWNHRQEIVSWAMLHLEEFGAGGYTVVGYDGPEGLKKAQATFNDAGNKFLFVPIVPGNDERVTDMVTRLQPAGQGNDAIFQWANDYFDAHLIVLFLGHPLNMKAQSTGMNSDQGSHAKDILTSIHKSDAEILDTTMTHEVLTRLKEENDPNGDYTLEFESAIRAVDKEAGMTRVKALFDMGAKIPSKYAYMLADVPEVEDGDTNYLQSVQYQQQEQQQLIDEHAPPMGTEDTSYLERGANHQEDVSGIFRAGSKPTGVTLAEARRKLEAKGVASEDVLATLAKAVSSGKLVEHDDDGGLSYSPGSGNVVSYSTEVDPSAKWTEEDAPRAAGGRRWRNIETGQVTYKQPSAGRHVQVGGDEHAADKLNRAQGEGVGVVPGKGVATHGVHARILMLAKEGGASLKGEGVLSEVMNVDKRLKKAETVQLAGRLGLRVDSSTSKTAALAHIEHALRLKAGSVPKPGGDGSEAVEPVSTRSETKPPEAEAVQPTATPPDSTPEQVSPRGDSDTSSSGDSSTHPSEVSENNPIAETPDDDATAPRKADEPLKQYLARIGQKKAAKDVAAYARKLHRQAKDGIDEHNAVIKQAVDNLSDQYGKNLRRNSPEWNNFEGDHTQMAGFDEMAATVIADNPGLFQPEPEAGQHDSNDIHSDNVEKLWEMLKNGKKEYPDLRESEDKAVAEAEAAGYDTGAVEEDTSFDYGANLPGEDNEKSRQQDHSETQEVQAEASETPGGDGSTNVTEAGATLASGTDGDTGDAEGSAEALPAASAGDTARPGDTGHGDSQGSEAGRSLGDEAIQNEGATEAGDTGNGSDDVGAAGVFADQQDSGMRDGQGSGDPDKANAGFMEPEAVGTHSEDDAGGSEVDSTALQKGGLTDGQGTSNIGSGGAVPAVQPGATANQDAIADGGREVSPVAAGAEGQTEATAGAAATEAAGDGFMSQPEPGPHTAELMPSYRGQSFTNDAGLLLDVRQGNDGTWSVGGTSGLTQQGAANLLNQEKAYKAQGLFGDEVTAQPDNNSIYEDVAKHFGIPVDAVKDALATEFKQLQARDNDNAPNYAEEQPYTRYEKHKLGAVRAASWNNDPSQSHIDYMTEHDVPSVLTSEHEDGIKTRDASYPKYVEWAKQGHEPPPINTSSGADGKIVSSNRRRVLAAQEAGVKKIKAWHSAENPHTGNPLKYGDVLEHAKSLGWTPAKPVEQLQWPEPAKPRQDAELPGMRDTFAPGMFGAAAGQQDVQGDADPVNKPVQDKREFRYPLRYGAGSERADLAYMKDKWNNRKWGMDAIFDVGHKKEKMEDGRMLYTTSASYSANLRDMSKHYDDMDEGKETDFIKSVHDLTDEKPYEFDFENITTGYGDKKDSYGIVGTGNARDVIDWASGLMLGALHRYEKKFTYMTASEPSRAKLYDFLVSRVTRHAPKYKGIKFDVDGWSGAYAIVKDTALESVMEAAREHGIPFKVMGENQ